MHTSFESYLCPHQHHCRKCDAAWRFSYSEKVWPRELGGGAAVMPGVPPTTTPVWYQLQYQRPIQLLVRELTSMGPKVLTPALSTVARAINFLPCPLLFSMQTPPLQIDFPVICVNAVLGLRIFCFPPHSAVPHTKGPADDQGRPGARPGPLFSDIERSDCTSLWPFLNTSPTFLQEHCHKPA